MTNFERREFRGHASRFVYEELSFRPDRYDIVGFGPTAISYADLDFFALKAMNPDRFSDYVAAVGQGRSCWDREFVYDSQDRQVFYLIRRLAAMRIDRSDYKTYFGSDPFADFPRQFERSNTRVSCA